MPVVELDVKTVEITFAVGGDFADELLRRFASFLGGDHDWCAMRIVGADEVHLVPLHTLEAHPDIGLDVLHDVPDMERAIGVGQGGGDKDATLVHEGNCRTAAKGLNCNKLRYAPVIADCVLCAAIPCGKKPCNVK